MTATTEQQLELATPILVRADWTDDGPKVGLYLRGDGTVLLLADYDPDGASEVREVTLHEALDWWAETLDLECECSWDFDGQRAFMAKIKKALPWSAR